MTTDRTSPGAARVVKTGRVVHVITAPEAVANRIDVDVVWDTPFVDLNYTVTLQTEAVSPTDPQIFFFAAFTRAVDKVTATVLPDGVFSAGQSCVIHAIAIHD